jgi:SAM-dependent methyltransferase
VIATADALPFDDNAFDASMACLTIHHWPDLEAGLREMRRVTRGPLVLMTFDPNEIATYWLDDYCPEMAISDKFRFPTVEKTRSILGEIEVVTVKTPLNCLDGYQEAFYGRPEMLLREDVRRAQSGWGFVPDGAEERFVQHLYADLQSGIWDEKYGYLRSQPSYEGALRLYISRE